ncbi:MAG: DNA primase [Bacteroidetes bacterium]|nr:DNA primase [Bacteroidota bacterium]
MRIPEHKIEQIRSSISIVDLISEYIQLRKRGKNYTGLCPFHNEKTPSFTVSEEKQIFHCFGCHAGGNVYKFLMEYEKISFVEAVQELAEKLGIDLELEKSASDEQQNELEELYELNNIVARYFSDLLLVKPNGELAKKYFEDRNLNPKILRIFGLGYSLLANNSFVHFAEDKNLDFNKLITLGLVGRSEKGRLFDKYPGRIIFPIFSPNGRVIAFAGRKLDPSAPGGKYINSPETPIYIKGRTLYGLSHAKDEIRKKGAALVVEGYMDLLALYQNDIKNVVAVSGTAFTEEQVQLLSRYTKNVILLFDSDTAGIKASMRSIEILLGQDFEIKITALPKDEDPDSYVNKYGKDKFYELLNKARNFLEYQTAYYEDEGMFEEPVTTAEAIRELVKPAALIKDELKRSLLIKTIAKKFNLREMLIETELNKALKNITKLETAQQRRTSQTKYEESEINKKQKDDITSNLQTERDLIILLFESDIEITKYILGNLNVDDFLNERHRVIVRKIADKFSANEVIDPSLIMNDIKDESIDLYLRELLFDKYSISAKWEELMPDSENEYKLFNYTVEVVNKMKINILNKLIEQNLKELELAESEDEKSELMKLELELKNERSALLKK